MDYDYDYYERDWDAIDEFEDMYGELPYELFDTGEEND